MRIGDLVRYRYEDDGRIGVVKKIYMSPSGRHQRAHVCWFKPKQVGSYFTADLEVICE